MLAHSQTRILLTKFTVPKSPSLPSPSFRRLLYNNSPRVKPQTVATGRPGGDPATKTAPAEQKDKRPWVAWVGIFVGLATAGFATGYTTADTSSKSSQAGAGITPLGKDVDRGVNGGGAVKSLEAVLSSEGGRDSGSPTRLTVEQSTGSAVPGDPKTLKSSLLEAGSTVMQSSSPINKIHEHVCGFHFYSGDIGKQVEAHHFCSHLNEDFRQCVIYDGSSHDARLIGVEYIISERLFRDLPDSEKVFWHSHVYEVMGGVITMPASKIVPEAARDEAEMQVMQQLVGTYGKTVHTWNVLSSPALPLGPPHLMMAFTSDGQISPHLIAKRDQNEGRSTDEIRRKREEKVMLPRGVVSGADAWDSRGGMAPVLEVRMVKMRGLH